MTRNSNIELLRIIMMLFIITHHVLLGLGIYNTDVDDFNYNWLYSFINQLCYIGVNVFILISGYFRIKFSIKKIIYLYLLCSIYIGIGCLFNCYTEGIKIGRWRLFFILYNMIFSFSQSPLWYVPMYVSLYILSPFINVMLDHLNKSLFNKLLLSLFIINCYFGYFWVLDVNPNGYRLMQFVSLYILGSYIKKYNISTTIKFPFIWGFMWAISAFVSTVIVFYILLFTDDYGLSYKVHAYNNPFVILSSVAFFCMFIRMNFNNKFVNYISKSTFSIYLLHCNPFIGKYVFSFFENFYTQSLCGVIFSVLGIYFICLMIDMFIRNLFIEPTYKLICKIRFLN